MCCLNEVCKLCKTCSRYCRHLLLDKFFQESLSTNLFSFSTSFSFQARLDASQNESYLTISSLQDEVAQLKAVREEVQKYVRELEQANDDLERAKRCSVFLIKDHSLVFSFFPFFAI